LCNRTRKWEATIGLVAVLCALLAEPVFADTYAVTILDDEFDPKILIIAPGDTVVWTNTTGSAHTVAADDGSFASADSGQPFIPFGQSYSHTFPDIGRNPYYCLLHGGPGGQGMSGVVRVVDPSVNTPPATPAPISPASGATNQSIAPTLTASAFSDSDVGDTHLSSQWLVRNASTGFITDTGEDPGHKTTLPLSGLTFSTTYFWSVRYRDDRGAWGEYSSEVSFTTVADQPASGTGLAGSYGKYAVKTATATILATTIDPTIEFDWKLKKPHASVPSNNFFVRWEGKVTPAFSERFRFWVRADGGVRLWINGHPIIDDWIAGRFAIYRNGLVNLDAGVPATIKLEYFDTFGASSVSLRWSSRSQPTEIVPQARLFPLTP
jgi:plastocyanin